jgi:hypothetical protein
MATQSVKDILDTEIPSPAFSFTATQAAPLPGNTYLDRPKPARAYDPSAGRFKEVGVNTARIHGQEQGLLIESQASANKVVYSADVGGTGWSNNNVASGYPVSVSSIIKEDDESANKFKTDVDSPPRMEQSVGEFSGNHERVSATIENVGGATASAVTIYNIDANLHLSRIVYNWDNDTLTVVSGQAKYTNREIIAEVGPNGGKVVRFESVVGPANPANNTTDNGRIFVYSDWNNDGVEMVCHHAQKVSGSNDVGAVCATVPVVSGSSSGTKGKDQFEIFTNGAPSWWNEQEGTFVAEVEIRNLVNGSIVLAGGGQFSEQALGFSKRDGSRTWNVRVRSNSGQIEQGGVPAYERTTVAGAFSRNDMAAAVNGNVRSQNYSADSIVSENQLVSGQRNAGSFLLKSLVYYPKRLSDDRLKIITS